MAFAAAEKEHVDENKTAIRCRLLGGLHGFDSLCFGDPGGIPG